MRWTAEATHKQRKVLRGKNADRMLDSYHYASFPVYGRGRPSVRSGASEIEVMRYIAWVRAWLRTCRQVRNMG